MVIYHTRKFHGWKTLSGFLLGFRLFSGANLLLVSGSVPGFRIFWGVGFGLFFKGPNLLACC